MDFWKLLAGMGIFLFGMQTLKNMGRITDMASMESKTGRRSTRKLESNRSFLKAGS
ncbi:MAG: hypothetical protein PVH87_24885 [Desulfobacteraceae bacterium]